MKAKKGRGRPRSDDPKIKLDNVRLKTSLILEIEVLSEELNMNKSQLIEKLLNERLNNYRS